MGEESTTAWYAGTKPAYIGDKKGDRPMAREARANIRMAQSTWNAYEDVAQALGLRTTALMRQVIEGAVPAMQQMGAALGRADQESVKVVRNRAPEG